jgi:hypothetical protein
MLGDNNADTDVELAGRLVVGIILGRLPGNGEGPRYTAIIELPKMSCEENSRHLQEAFL